MARVPKPWWRDDRQSWFVNIRGERHNLGPNKQEAFRKFHAMMGAKPEAPPPTNHTCLSIVEVLDKYLDWCKKHREPRTYEWYRDHIQGFVNHVGEIAKRPVADLKPFHIIEWVDSHGGAWSPAYRRGAIGAIQRPFNWAEELGYVPASPIKRIAKPTPQRREQFVTPADWIKIRDHYEEGDPFRDLLEFSWESGCRPQESKSIEARHVDMEHHRVIFPPTEAKGKKRWRIIRMTPRAEEIIKKHLADHSEGVLFRNEDGRPWTAQAMACRFGRLKDHLGVKFCAYAFRHGFCQDLLEQGNDPISVAELMGHADARMVSQVYSHMNQADKHLDRVLKSRKSTRQEIDK